MIERLHRIRWQLALLLMTIVLWPTTTFAQDGEAAVQGDDFLSLSPGTVRILVAAVIPLLTGVLTKASWSSWVKGLITLALNFANAAIIAATLADGHAAWSQVTLRETLIGFVVSVATYAGIYQGAGLTSTPQPNGIAKLANVGVK